MNAGTAAAREQRVRNAFAAQAGWCRRLGSPFTALLCELAAERLDPRTKVGGAILDWEGVPEPEGDALALRFAGGLHALARRRRCPSLSGCYPPNPLADADRLWRSIEIALEDRGDELMPWLFRAPQTNDVGRSSVLISGLLSAETLRGRSVALLELGAAAGLNMRLDRYAHLLGGIAVGDARSPLRLEPEWSGPPPPAVRVSIAERHGVDLHPLDLGSENYRERLFAYVWADQQWRLDQLERALSVCAADPPRVDQGRAGEWLEGRLPRVRSSGIATVVMHSFAFQYFEAAEQERIRETMESAGRHAAAAEPLLWLRFESDPRDERPSLRLTAWPGGKDRLLAFCHPHGRSVRWLGGPAGRQGTPKAGEG